MKNLTNINNEILYREQYKKFIEKQNQEQIKNNFKQLMLKCLSLEEDSKILEILDPNNKLIIEDSIQNNYFLQKNNIISFEKFCKNKRINNLN